MDNTKLKSLSLVVEGISVAIIVHGIGGYWIAPKLAELFTTVPLLTISLLSSSAISPLIAAVYLFIRTKRKLDFSFQKRTILSILLGFFIAWIILVQNVFYSGKDTLIAEEFLTLSHPFLYPTLFIFLLWGPFIEEVLYRGYILEVLRKSWGETAAIVISSVVFVLPHGIWGYMDYNLIYILLYSFVFSFAYIKGKLIAPITIHTFVNVYYFYICIP